MDKINDWNRYRAYIKNALADMVFIRALLQKQGRFHGPIVAEFNFWYYDLDRLRSSDPSLETLEAFNWWGLFDFIHKIGELSF